MELAEIKELIALMRKNKIQEIDLEQEGSKVRILAQDPAPSAKKGADAPQQGMPPFQMPPFFFGAPPAGSPAPAPAASRRSGTRPCGCSGARCRGEAQGRETRRT